MKYSITLQGLIVLIESNNLNWELRKDLKGYFASVCNNDECWNCNEYSHTPENALAQAFGLYMSKHMLVALRQMQYFMAQQIESFKNN